MKSIGKIFLFVLLSVGILASPLAFAAPVDGATKQIQHVVFLMQENHSFDEYEIEALIEYVFRRNGAAGPAYPSIVAAGANATILHYTVNDRPLLADDLLLIDAGAELDCYCADITRTSNPTPKCVSVLQVSSNKGQSESLPITTATSAFVLLIRVSFSRLRPVTSKQNPHR